MLKRILSLGLAFMARIPPQGKPEGSIVALAAGQDHGCHGRA